MKKTNHSAQRSRKARAASPARRSLFAGFGAALVLIILFMLPLIPTRRIFADTGTGSVSLTALNTAISTETFDTLSNTAGSTTNTTLPTGWYITETGGGARDNEQYAVDTGASTTGDTYSYGAAGSTDRALGELRSGTLIPLFGAKFTNNTGATITSLDVSYTGEQWRFGGVHSTVADRLDFQYSVDATDLSTGTYLDANALDFNPPITTGTASALDGNAAANRTALSSTITGLSIPAGATFFIRFNDVDATGADDGLAIDNFSLTPHGGVAQPNLTINDVSLNEGNAGTTSFTFTVSLSAPAGPGGVTFDIATADGTAVAPTDYTSKSLTSQTIPAGSSTYSFTVLVNGDTTPETNETFFVNVTNVTGATVTDGQGQGTIVNDDAAPNLTINDVSLNEGNSGTTSFTFTVSLSAPAGPGGVTFDIATADGTATAPSDYTSKSLTGQTIPAGSSTYSFTVLVNGDTTAETNETFFVNVTNITNAIGTDTQGLGTIVNDDVIKIHDVQGNGATSPLVGSTVSVEGVVTANFQGTDKLSGFFLQEEDADADADPNTSEGIFIFCSSCPSAVAEGQRVRATGPVSEFNGMTEITASSGGSVTVTDAGNHLAEVTASVISLPVVGDIDAFYEAREGMLVTFADTLTVSEYFELGRFGQIELFQGGRPRTYTEANTPGVAGYNAHLDDLARRRVILDDDNNNQESYLLKPDGQQAVYYPHANGGFSVGTQGTDFFRGGDLVNGLTGVLHWSFPGFGDNTWRIRPTNAHPVNFTVANPRPAVPNVGGSIKAVGMNLLNYFTTIDTTSSDSTGPCGPSGGQDCRGADSVAELNRQRERASIVVCSLNADVYAFMELENTTPSNTINDILGAVNARCGGAHPYAFVNTGGTLGTDAIRVQLIYRTGVLSPVGSPIVDLDPIHNRPPTAQTFDVVDASNPAFGKRFTVIANHFKSKGCDGATGGDLDQGDGQSCFNARRTAQANRLLTWINSTVIPAAGDSHVLLLGDFNSYAKEDPVAALVSGGFTDLETALNGPSTYSYLFDGELGHLDYAFANAAMASEITGVSPWHINADECDLFDYNDEVKDAGEATFEEKPDGSALVPPRVVFAPGTPYRASDHDPVLVGLFPPCENTPKPTVGANGPTTFCQGGSVTLTSSTADSYQWNLNNGPINGATSQSYTATASGSYTVTVVISGCTVTSDPTVVTVNPIPATPTVMAGGPTTFCSGGSVTLTSSSATGNQWFNSGNAINGATGQSYVATASGSYTVVVTTNGCSSAASTPTVVTVNPTPAKPTITAGGPTSFCSGGSVTLTSSSATGNQWFNNGNIINGATGQSLVVTASGSYTVAVTSGTCTSPQSDPTVVMVNPAPPTPTVTAGGPTTFCPGGSVTLTSSSATGNQWYLNGNIINGATGQSYVATASGSYTVKVTNGGCTSAASSPVVVTASDTTPPQITCPANITRVLSGSSCPMTTSGVVTYTTPTATDNCPNVSVVCSPPSGSTFALGTSSVSCMATDGGGNTASCSFTITVYTGCVQDDSNPGNVVLYNHVTGAYRFCCGGTLVSTGTGTVTLHGCTLTIQQNVGTTRALIKVDTTTKTGSASLQDPVGTVKCLITDRNLANNTCACQ